jgi:hypothetical protein
MKSVPPPLPHDDDEKTPAGVLVTPKERGIIVESLRSIIKAVVPFLPKIAASAGPALVVWLLALVHASGVKDDTDKEVKEVKATTARAYKAVADPAKKNDDALAAALAALVKRMDATEATQKAQSALILAREGDIVIQGRPARKLRRVDRALVKAVKDNAAKDSKELETRKPKVAPAIVQIPADIPPPPPEKKDSPPAPVQGTQSTP